MGDRKGGESPMKGLQHGVRLLVLMGDADFGRHRYAGTVHTFLDLGAHLCGILLHTRGLYYNFAN